MAKQLHCRYRVAVLLSAACYPKPIWLVIRHKATGCTGIHAFSGSLEEARAFIRCGLLIGIGTLVLNPNAHKVRTAAAELPLEHLVLETDSPFMPTAGAGENTPANVRQVAETVAALRGISMQKVADVTEQNVNRLLSFS